MYTVKASLLGLIILLTINLNAQTDCSCSKLFGRTLQKIKENYIGYQLTKDKIGEAYLQHTKNFERLTANAPEDSCTFLLQDFLRFFKDGHLFVTEIPNYLPGDLLTIKEKIKNSKYNVEKIYSYLLENKSRLNAVEGIWTDGNSKFAVVKNIYTSVKHEYVAIVSQHTDTSKLGEIKFGLNTRNGKLEGVYYTNGYAPRYLSADVVKAGTVLSLSGGFYWGKISFSNKEEIQSASLYNPVLPTVTQLNTETALISIPSFLIEKKQLDEVLIKNYEMITAARYVTIDIRGNNGGNGIYFDLMGLYAEKPAVSDTGLALSSADNIAYFEEFSGGRKNNLYGAVVEEMKANTGKIVSGPKYQPMKINHIPSEVEKVIILTDGANASAAETFILFSKQVSNKVITIGQNTSGTIDYQSINMIKLGCDKKGIYFGYPTSTSTKYIPESGYNSTGIKPDIYTAKTGNDLLLYVQEFLQKK